ncbi:MAG: HAD family hydrolase [Oscillospiraceae bacterium]|nr:HAD family hydrolase [Oscillospiraceae bacterium]
MKRPEMIFFDLGHTLTYSPEKNRNNGFAALWEHRVKGGCTLDELIRRAERIFHDVDVVTDSFDYDIPFAASLKLLLDSAGVVLDIPPFEQEKVFLNAARPVVPMPGAVEMTDRLRDMGIRLAVITNNRFSEGALLAQLEGIFGEGAFEFVISSADYMVRKPDKRLFEAALNRADITADRAWHCGDVANADVMGAHYAGIFPVLYEETLVENPFLRFNRGFVFESEYMHINSWGELCSAVSGI